MKNYIIVGLTFVIGLAATQLIYAQTLEAANGNQPRLEKSCIPVDLVE